MAEDSSFFDFAATVSIVGLNLVAVLGTLLLILHRARPFPYWERGLSVLWGVICAIGAVSFLVLIYKLGLSRPTSGVDRMMRSALLIALGPMSAAAALAIFFKPK